MDIEIEYIDQNRNISTRTETINAFGLLKHIAIAGQGYLPSLKYYTRVFGIFCHYIEYLNPRDLSASRFSQPPPKRRDPTEKGQFSNLVGKGIGDFLSKCLSGAKVTHNYEAAMTIAGLPISGNRPDLYCVGNNFQFALEAKGSSAASISSNEMFGHKKQARSGRLPVNYSVASVSYNLYDRVLCKYHDPFNDNVEFSFKTNQELNRIYYTGLFEYLDFEYFRIEEGQIDNKHCFFIDVLGPGTPYTLRFGGLSAALIIQSEFKKFTINESSHFNEAIIQGPQMYLDTDGVGFCLMEFKSDKRFDEDGS
jgi:hypothetical protein